MEFSKKRISVDSSKCSGCRICESVCSLIKEHKILPRLSRIRIVGSYEIGVDKPIICKHCNTPACLEACPADAINKSENGLVLVNKNKCTGCESCIKACPFDAMFFDPNKKKAFNCDLCDGDPECVKVCPTKAITIYVE